MAIQVTVKWNNKGEKKVFKDVELDPTEELEVFKAQLFTLSGVPVEKQKILVKGKMLKTQADLGKIKNKAKLMLMGSAESLPPPPTKEIIFLEDLPDEKKNELDNSVAAGLENLGNTCYMNSTLQCLRHIPELKDSFNKYSKTPVDPSSRQDMSHTLTQQMGSLFRQLDGSADAVTPHAFTSTFRSAYPQFAQRGDSGHFMQQDADECLQQLLATLKGRLGKNFLPEGADSKNEQDVIEYLFGGQMKTEMKCDEAADEPATEGKEAFLKLRCHINREVNYMFQGIGNNLTESLEKRSPSLGRNAVYTKTSKISQLPRYLVVQMVRFFWKTDVQKKSKILRKVKYSKQFDILPFCDDELKTSLTKARTALKEANDRKMGLEPLKLAASTKEEKAAGAGADADGDVAMSLDAIAAKAKADIEANPVTRGFYEIFGVVTHKGRDADSGHYVGWAKNNGDDEWTKFDDAKTSPCKLDDVLNLCGGGDWHMSYLVMYKRKDDMEAFHAEEKKEKAKAQVEEVSSSATADNAMKTE